MWIQKMHSVMSKVLFSIFLHCWRHILLQTLSRTGYSTADDSSLDLPEMFPPLHLLSFLIMSQFLILLLFLIQPHISPTLLLLLSKPLKKWITSWAQFLVFAPTPILSFAPPQCPLCLMRQSSIQISQIWDQEAEVEERGGKKRRC